MAKVDKDTPPEPRKLSADQVREARWRYARKHSTSRIVREMGLTISRVQLWYAVTGRTYRWVDAKKGRVAA